ncbi:hypothetical protein AXK58_00620 [Tsukamurella tyrosinosolvens]|uniref:Uncharacterized protein n=1 Tax=Tsukamurella tyrosinosolvens TaxID=57704 RepID=A0A1H4X1R0_TSUTY|nr:hypothetical protein [Tsukamurella tyrosinosolvens]KXO99761.1 hypothetical protein AXK58_00620 [Tsukamurella tyrosinosolvens]MEC4612490.1 hypothetical protein [Tsukamurella tyrosinosolvens]SEC99493.1 hypothetical protein SAMN04489793_3714 [Tsukamurella tyrosinosolvens]
MAETVPQEIAQRVTTAADAVPVGREQAQAAAHDAAHFLQNLRATAIDDAYRRFTASNTPGYLAHLQYGPPPQIKKGAVVAVVMLFGAFLVSDAIATVGVGAFLLLLLAVAGVLGVHGWRVSKYRRGLAEREQARLDANPWPFRAERTPAYNPEAEPGQTRVETRLLGVAVLLTEEIRRSPAWNNPLLDQHRVRINLDATLQDISHRAYRVWRMRTDTPRPSGASPATPALAQHIDEYTHAARLAEDALRDHVAALAEYLGELRPVERLLGDLQILDRTNSSAHRELLDQLYRDAVGNEADALRFQHHADELRDLQASLDAQFHFLREQVARTNLLR